MGIFFKSYEQFPEDYYFLIFTGAIEWTKANFPFHRPNMIFIEGNRPYIDLYLMSLCEHQIVSPGSTFSWWAAWLNKNPQKKVIAPAVWADGRSDLDTVCDSWVKLEGTYIP